MSRAPAGDVIETKPQNNVYTALVAVAFLAELIALVVLVLKSTEIFDRSLWN